MEAGALDAFTTPISMKKGRPAVMVTVLAEPRLADTLEQILFAETPTFGVRRWQARRTKLDRSWKEVQTAWGSVRIKLGLHSGRCITATPEYEDCRKLAASAGVPVRDVLQSAQQAAETLTSRAQPHRD
jgi:uncharacterized protein (DUF111 family)